jgi:hypothetical protein
LDAFASLKIADGRGELPSLLSGDDFGDIGEQRIEIGAAGGSFVQS